MDCIWVNLKNVGPPLFKFMSVYIKMCHLNSWKIILSCYVAVILQMKDSCSVNLTFRAHVINKIKQNYLKQRDLAPGLINALRD